MKSKSTKHETFDTEHPSIYYERKQVQEVALLPKPLSETIQTESARQTECESPTDRVTTSLPISEPERNIPQMMTRRRPHHLWNARTIHTK